MTKTQTRTIIERIGKAEAEAEAVAKATAKARQDAATTLPEAAESIDTAELKVADIEASWASGDDTPTANDYAVATAEVTKAQALAKAAESALAKATRATPSTDTALAQALVPVVESALPGVPVVATFVNIEEAPELAETPVAVIVQSGAVENNDGVLSGKVGVLYFRTEVQRELSRKALQSAAEDLGLRCTAHVGAPQSKGNGVLLDRATLPVAHAVPTMPTIRKVKTSNLTRLLTDLTSGLAATGSRGGPVRFDAANKSYRSDTLTVEAVSAHIDSERVDERLRTLGVKLIAGYSSHTNKTKRTSNALDAMLGIGKGGVSDGIERVVSDFEGRFLPGLGRVTAAEVIRHARSDHGAHALTVGLTIESATA